MTTGGSSSTPRRTCSGLPLLRTGNTVAVSVPISSVLARFHLYYYSDNTATSEDKETILMVDTQPEEAAGAAGGEVDDPLGKAIQSK